jgi:hypothetical protein
MPKNVLHLCIQIVRSLIDEFEVASFDLSPLQANPELRERIQKEVIAGGG